MNRIELSKKISQLTSELIKEKGYISFTDLFIKLNYLSEEDYTNWRMKRVPYLEKVIKVNLGSINFIMKEVRKNSIHGKLKQSYTGYMSWGKGRKIPLRFSKTCDENIEKAYATHFVLIKAVKEKKAILQINADTNSNEDCNS